MIVILDITYENLLFFLNRLKITRHFYIIRIGALQLNQQRLLQLQQPLPMELQLQMVRVGLLIILPNGQSTTDR